MGLGWDGNNLWMSSRYTDPDTSQLVDRFLKLNPTDGSLLTYIDYPVEDYQGPQGITFDSDGHIRVASWSTNAIYKISTEGELISYFRPPNPPRGVAWDGYSVWSISSGTAIGELGELYHHSADGYLIDTFYIDIGKRTARDLAFDGRNFWLSIQDYTQNLYKIDQSGNILEVYNLTDQGVPGSPYGLVWFNGHLWVGTTSFDWKIYQLKPTTYVPPPRGDLDFDGDVDGDDLEIFSRSYGTYLD
jgi:streptogramin lyase